METINKYESVFLESPRDESGILLNRCFDIVNNKLVPFAVNPNHIDAFHTLSEIHAQDPKNFPNELHSWAWSVSATDEWVEQSSNVISAERTNSSIIQFIDVSKSVKQANTLFGQLLDGLYLGCPLVGDQVLFSFTQDKHNLGILCRKNILDIASGTIKINNQQYSIPVYQYSPNRALSNIYPKCMLVDTVDLGVPATYVLRPEKNILNALYIAIYMAFACHKYQKTDIYQAYDNWPELESTFNEAIAKQYKTNVLFNLKRIINCSTAKTKQLLDLFINFVQPFFPEPLTPEMITSPDVYNQLLSSLKDIYSSSEKLNKFLHGILLINSNIINDLTQDESLISSSTSTSQSTSPSPNSGIGSSSSSSYGSGHGATSSSGSYSNTYANAASDDLAATYQKDRTLYSYNNSSEDKSTTTQSSSVNSATSSNADLYQHENNGQSAAVESSNSNQSPNTESITQDEASIDNSQASGLDDIRESTVATEQSSDNKPTDTNSSLDSAVLTNSNSDVNAPAHKGSTIQNSTPTANNSLSTIPNDGASIEELPSRDAQLSNQEEISTQEPIASAPNTTSLSASTNTIENASKSENESKGESKGESLSENDSLDDTKIVKSKARTILRLRPKEGKESKESDTEKTAYQSLALNYVSHDINRTAEHSLRAVCANLNGSFASENIISPLLSQMLTCYLTVMHHYRIPLLLLGPYKDHIVSSFTYGAYQQGYNQILLSDSFKSMEFEHALKNCRRFAMVDNLFSPGYSDNVMPLSKEHSELGIYLSYPFYSDIQLQPKSIFAYAMPLISEFFIVNDLVTRYPSYQGSTMYFSTKDLVSSATLNDACMADYSKLGLSQLVLNRTKYILGATTELMHYSLNNNVFEPTDTEYTYDSLMANISLLFGLAPLSLCLGRSELLNEALENDLIFTEIRENLKPFCS